MSRSKSPDMVAEKKFKPRLKSIGTGQYSNTPLIHSVQFSGSNSNSNKNRLNLVPNVRSSKLLKPKRSMKSFKSPVSKSPSSSVLHTAKEDAIEKFSNPVTIRVENFRRIDELLKKVYKTDENQVELDSDKKFEIFNLVFDEIIERDKQFSRYLHMIKIYYQSYYEQKLLEKTEELQMFKKSQEKLKNDFGQERTSLQRTVETLSRENLQLSRDIDKCENLIESLQDQLDVVHNYDSSSVDKSQENWNCLLLEIKFYTELCKSLQKEVEIYKQNQEMFLKKFEELKTQGVEVSYEYSECLSSLSSVSNTQTDFMPKLINNKSVPNLNFSRIQDNPNLF